MAWTKVVRKAGCWVETREILTAANLAETRAAMKVENWAERMV